MSTSANGRGDGYEYGAVPSVDEKAAAALRVLAIRQLLHRYGGQVSTWPQVARDQYELMLAQQTAYEQAFGRDCRQFQAITERNQMLADLTTAESLADLKALWVNWTGHTVIEERNAEVLRGDLEDYIREFCVACGIQCPQAL